MIMLTGGDESAVVLHALVGPTPGLLLLVLLRHLGRLPPHLPGTCQRSVNLTCNANRSTKTINMFAEKIVKTLDLI